MEKRLLSLGEAAAYCGVSKSSYRNYVKLGVMPDCVPGIKKYDKNAIDRFLDLRSGLLPSSEKTEEDEFDIWLKNSEFSHLAK